MITHYDIDDVESPRAEGTRDAYAYLEGAP
jgi:hypothetical protein